MSIVNDIVELLNRRVSLAYHGWEPSHVSNFMSHEDQGGIKVLPKETKDKLLPTNQERKKYTDDWIKHFNTEKK
jgi:hypothetical protein